MSSGLTVRWSLIDASAVVADELATYVAGTSHARFEGKDGLAHKTWRMRPGAWFEGCYVFVDDAARAEFQHTFTAGAAESPVSVIVGAAPELIEECEVVGVAAGAGGFTSRPSYDR
jgi:hypothetical protein